MKTLVSILFLLISEITFAQTYFPKEYANAPVRGLMQRLDSVIRKTDFQNTGQLTSSYRAEYLYSPFNQLMSEIISDSLPGQWVYNSRKDYQYTLQLLLSEEKSMTWLTSDSMWVDVSKTHYFYTLNNSLEQAVTMGFDTATGWRNQKRSLYTYTANGDVQEIEIQKWSTVSSQWQAESEYLYSYYPNGSLMMVGQNKLINAQWKPYSRTDYFYFLSGKLNYSILAIYNNTSEVWRNYSRLMYSYDTFNNLIETYSYSWDEPSSSWASLFREDHTYDNSFSFQELIVPHYYELFLFTHLKTQKTAYSWSTLTNQWSLNPVSSYLYYYSPYMVSGIAEKSSAAVSVSPNPTSDYVAVKSGTYSGPVRFTLFDLQGRQVLSESFQTPSRVSVNHLPGGVYVYRCQFGNTIENGRLVVNK
jgi:hypothetical protein